MAKKTYTAVSMQQRTFNIYDAEHVIIYPNEEIDDNYQFESMGDKEKPKPTKVYIYTGEERDGGYIVQCADPTDCHELTNAIIRTRYSISDELALQRHHQEDAESNTEEWENYCAFADTAIAKAKKWLGIA